MKGRFALGLALVAGSLALGLAFQDAHVRLDVPDHALPNDQVVLGHRDSPYTSMTWVASESNDFLQLRFFDRVEGGICLHPGWSEIAADPRLAHLRPEQPPAPAPGGVDPGPVNNSPYITFFPAGLLLNRSVPKAPKVLIVGLGSGIGIAQVAYHFPEASIEVVDIDPAVIAMVRQQFPLLAWLEGRRTAAGEPRLRFVARDARAEIGSLAGKDLDLIVLDAYTAGSTIPPHLMTREFFAECKDALAPDGVLLANVIGCYGEKDTDGRLSGFAHRVLGGALRSMRAAGLTGAWCIPVLHAWDNPASFRRDGARNNIVVASRRSLKPHDFPEGWARLRAWVPFPELELGRYVSRQMTLADKDGRPTSTYAPAKLADDIPGLAAAAKPYTGAELAPHHTQLSIVSDRNLILAAAAAVRAAGGQIAGWDDVKGDGQLQIRSIDWIQFPRETWRASIAFAGDENRHDPDLLVGPPDGPEREAAMVSWSMTDAPLFTDQTPNADIMNH